MPFDNNDRNHMTVGQYRQTPAKVAVVHGLNKTPTLSDANSYKDREVPSAFNSRFNPIYSFNVYDGIKLDTDFAARRADMEPTIANLLKEHEAPGLLYDATDFMHCKDAENVSGYHMITLRRFPYPVTDALMFENHPQVDMSRLVGYTTEENNKLSDIMSMSFGLRWKELTADFWTPDIIGDNHGATGLLGTVFRLMNPNYIAEVGAGKNGLHINPMYDQNKVYGPVDSLTSTHIRDRGLNFEHPITLNFDYELRSYDGVNPKSAMLDLLSNVLVMTTNDATFWGGAINWYGIPKSYYQHYISVNDAHAMSTDYNKVTSYYMKQLETIVGYSEGNGMDWQKFVKNAGQMLLNNLGVQVLNKVLNVVGRPTVAVMNSLLSGEPIGTWHLTIGNPFRPILSIGDLILTDTRLTFNDQLGHDGFPTGFRVTVSLKHSKPRSRAEIETMFNSGMQRIYWQPTDSELKKNLANSRVYKNKSQNLLDNITNEVYRYLDKSVLTKVDNSKVSAETTKLR